MSNAKITYTVANYDQISKHCLGCILRTAAQYCIVWYDKKTDNGSSIFFKLEKKYIWAVNLLKII